jgi:hypothetical protein
MHLSKSTECQGATSEVAEKLVQAQAKGALCQGTTSVVPKRVLKRRGINPCGKTLFGTWAAGKTEGEAAFRLLNSAQNIEAALAAGLLPAIFPKRLEHPL